MKPTKDLIVCKLGAKFTIKKGSRAGQSAYRYVLKPTDKNDPNKEYYLNLPVQYENMQSWAKHLVKGNILSCFIQANNPRCVNYFMPFYVVKDVEKEKLTPVLPGQTSLV